VTKNEILNGAIIDDTGDIPRKTILLEGVKVEAHEKDGKLYIPVLTGKRCSWHKIFIREEKCDKYRKHYIIIKETSIYNHHSGPSYPVRCIFCEKTDFMKQKELSTLKEARAPHEETPKKVKGIKKINKWESENEYDTWLEELLIIHGHKIKTKSEYEKELFVILEDTKKTCGEIRWQKRRISTAELIKNIKEHPIHHEWAWERFLDTISFPKFKNTKTGLNRKFQLLTHIINIGSRFINTNGSHRLGTDLTLRIMGMKQDEIPSLYVFTIPNKIKRMLHDYQRRSKYRNRK